MNIRPRWAIRSCDFLIVRFIIGLMAGGDGGLRPEENQDTKLAQHATQGVDA